MAMMRHACALLAAVLLLFRTASAEVAMVLSVQRHGARNVLVKSPYLVETDAFGGPSLLPQGER